MPTLVNYSGDDEFYPGGFLSSIASRVDVYFPPSKRARTRSPVLLDQDTKPSIDLLPDECLFEIFRRLQIGKERSACACVSKRWLTLVSTIQRAEICLTSLTPPSNNDDEEESNGYLTRILDGKKATDLRLAAIAVGTSSHGGLGKLSIQGSNSIPGVTDHGLVSIARCCPSLKTLSLWNLSSVGDKGLTEIAKECNLLEKLDLSHCPLISDKGLISIAKSCPNLTVLSIESCPKIGNEGLQAIGKFSPKLRSVSIRDCPLVGDSGVSTLLSSSSLILTKIKLQALNITDFSLAVIGHYGLSVTKVTLVNLQNVSEKGFWVMGNARALNKLVSLTISSCRGITDLSLEALAKGCSNLKHMCLKKCCFVSDKALTDFTTSAGSLESLQLEECNRITLLGVIGLLSNRAMNFKSLSLVKCLGIKDSCFESNLEPISPCTSSSSLRSLSIRNCPGFGNVSLSMIGKSCPKIQHVHLNGLFGITDSELVPFFENCRGLVDVNLNGCLNLTDESVLSLAKLHGGTLEMLNLAGCWKITNLSLAVIAEYCLLLNELDVSKCGVTDSGLALLSCADQIALRVLSLSGCSQLTNKSLSVLKRLGENLVGLNLKNCCSISSGSIEALFESLWRCDILV